MYQHVIVPFDGSPECRAALAPASDLAWRCGAQVVIVTTTATDDEAAQHLLKSQAIAKSGADVGFWVDTGSEIGEALLEATRFRAEPLICVASRYRPQGLVRKKLIATPLPEAVLRHSTVPVLIIGPKTDLSRGLPLAELVMPIDDSPEAVRAARLAADWAIGLRIAVRFLSFVPPGAAAPQAPETVRQIHDEIRARAPSVVLELIETEQPAEALVAIAAEQIDAVILLPRAGGTEREPLDAFAREVVSMSTRAVLLAPPGT